MGYVILSINTIPRPLSNFNPKYIHLAKKSIHFRGQYEIKAEVSFETRENMWNYLIDFIDNFADDVGWVVSHSSDGIGISEYD